MTRQSILISVLAFVLVITLWWMFVMSPQRAKVEALEADVAAVEGEAVNLQARINSLELTRSKASEIEARIAALQSVVPSTVSMPAALRQLQESADDAGVVIVQMTTARPALVDDTTGLHAISVSIGVQGSYFQVVDFLRRVEDPTITARGLTFSSLSAAPGEYPTLVVALTGQMYSVLEVVTIEEAVPPPPATDPAAPADDAPSEEATP